MSEESSSQIIILDARRLFVAITVAVAVIVALAFGWFAIRWQIGNLLATGFNDIDDQSARQIAQEAYKFAPSDPKTSLLLARTENSEQSLGNYKQAIRLSPSDYRLWIDYARAGERKGELRLAEQAFRQAVELAPSYSSSHWFFGNFYLRQNKPVEAFAELRKSTENNAIYQQQVFSLVWTFFNQDTAELEKMAGAAPEMRAGLAKFFALKGRGDMSLKLWNTLSDEEKIANTDAARTIAQTLFDKQLFNSTIELLRTSGIDPNATSETVHNGSFEQPIGEAKETYFGWKISPVEKIDVKLDPLQKQQDNRSLRVTFNGYAEPALFTIYQFIAVKAKTKYSLSFWLRTENLKTGGAPNLEIYNAADSKNIAFSQPYPIGTNDWQPVKIEFTAPENTESIAIRTTRTYCGDKCPIFGTVWYDDFRLEKIK